MKTKHSLLLFVVFVSLVISAFGQDTKNEKSTTDDILSRQVELYLKGVTPEDMFEYLILQEGLKVGGVKFETDNTKRFDINIDHTLQGALDFVLAFDTRYHWIEEKGVINLLPIDEPKILNVHIPKFKATKSSIRQLIKELMKTDEIKNMADAIGFTFGGVGYFPSSCGTVSKEDEIEEENRSEDDIDCNGSQKTQNIGKFSVELDNLTLRQILNEIAHFYRKDYGAYVWKYSERRIVDSDGKERNYFYITIQ